MADWYYAKEGKRVGPVNEQEFQDLVSSGVITGDTLIWTQGMAQWQSYGQYMAQRTGAQAQAYPPGGGYQTCMECGNLYPADQMIRYGASMVCATCKPVFFQRLREGAPLPSVFIYGGFWIRVLAKIIDQIILGVANAIIQMIFMVINMSPMMSMEPGAAPPPESWIWYSIMMILQIAIPAAYTTFFLGKYAATPGKMVCGLKVVVSNGSPVSYWRAFGRHFAEMLSGIILGIGYLMAGFDDQKRTLHDRICDTRVIKK